MIKVVIVDDEPKLRHGLQTLIPWESLGFTVTATATNGKEALSVIEEVTPDVVIVDIRMPIMDGLQMIQHLTAAGRHLHFIILSGYADFEYAKQAIKYGVAGYLVKPVDIREMSASLQRVREQIEKERLHAEQSQKGSLNKDLHLHSLLLSHEKIEDPEKHRNKTKDAGLLWSGYEVVVISPRISDAEQFTALNQLSAGLKPMIEGRYKGVVTILPPYTVLLLNEPIRGKQRREEWYNEIRKASGGLRFVAASGGGVSVPEDICSSYLKAQEAVKQAFFSEKDRLLGPNSHALLPSTGSLRMSEDNAELLEEFIFKIYYSLDIGNQAMILPLLKEAAGYFLNQGQEEKPIKESFFFLSNAVVHKLTAGSRMEWKETEAVSRFLNGIFHHEHLHDLVEDINRFLIAFAKDTEPGGKEQEFKKMIDFINRHYADNLKLDTLAGLLNYSSAYLGQLFKNKTGEYFNTYLDKVRIQKAKEFLSQGVKVYEVAERIGYANVNYFHSKFKKYEGRSPSDYKNL
ncbi:response regulator transcription factor [Paenibacillus sp. YAF4_2]|uniref:response regulator transcription factor n=1 Tax=Paenibacillus sp. YAF4_2 TaxID=3233085 RepID=UPI003F9D5702